MNGKDAYWFSHDANARHDERIIKLRYLHGLEGYGLYWAMVETMREANGYQCSSDAIPMLEHSFNAASGVLEAVVKTCIDTGLFEEKNGVIFSPSLRRRMEELDAKRLKRQEAGRKGGKAKAMLKQCSSNAKANKGKKSKPDKKKYGSCVFLTDEEYARLAKRFGPKNLNAFIEKLGLHIESKGKDPYASHNAAILKWVVEAVTGKTPQQFDEAVESEKKSAGGVW